LLRWGALRAAQPTLSRLVLALWAAGSILAGGRLLLLLWSSAGPAIAASGLPGEAAEGIARAAEHSLECLADVPELIGNTLDNASQRRAATSLELIGNAPDEVHNGLQQVSHTIEQSA